MNEHARTERRKRLMMWGLAVLLAVSAGERRHGGGLPCRPG
ncbi:MAG: hypothetical protein M5R40_02180 [Anaerolineae bacterium]|nr:hypothetical protein [Anaerolineae bacterium]